jgi:hypothetical protein
MPRYFWDTILGYRLGKSIRAVPHLMGNERIFSLYLFCLVMQPTLRAALQPSKEYRIYPIETQSFV